MILSLILCGISLVALGLMVMNKRRELADGKAMFAIGSVSTDSRIATFYDSVVYMVTHVSVQSLRGFAKRMLLKVEKFFIAKFDQFSQKFSAVGNLVTGYDLPRNRGSVSFFLKNIEDHKKTMKKGPVSQIK